ncbi:A disintegrin and metalloproteinase with thrombospondin motifs 6-like [Stylophora pistillata]|uniref:A disintegrin and metalloproteinase with thrombospondin motifs 6-like n=1 Tax=Stylophora pistillata TaxID=50429 RepID=UPI000C045B0F|nr:A disintegrin and metalloproteinase with thrombospondin motifs 6-like [Stylophora pistillata]
MNLKWKIFFAIYYASVFIDGEVVGSNSFNKHTFNDVHLRMADNELHKTFGVDSREKVPEYEVIAPYQSDDLGNFVDYILHDEVRTRRAISEPDFWYFKIEAFGRSLHLNVTKVTPRVTAGAEVETVDNSGKSTYREVPRCVHYTGHVTSEPGSLVAISENKGLSGIIRTLQDTLYIRPLSQNFIEKNQLQHGAPHVIYRRSINQVLSPDLHVSASDRIPFKRTTPILHRRKKRQAPQKFLEIAMIADNFAISTYGEDEMTYHLLTIVHILTRLYHDSSVGPIKITPVIVRLVLKKDGFGYGPSASKIQRISAMERWAKENFPESDDDPHHPDAVILITKRSSGGIASIGSTCRSSFGAVLSNDIGLGSAIVVAHEIAHTMSVEHDGSGAALSCENNKNIMASSIPSGPGSMKWSACSRERLQEFLSQRSHCLDDIPPVSGIIKTPKEFYGKLPGQVVDRDEQCRMIYGKTYYACPQRRTNCDELGCTNNGYRCILSSTSPADGTRCGDRHWCINGLCVDDGSRVIHGRWSDWSVFSKCTRPCGGGVQHRSRTCTNPAPKNGGRNCIGPKVGHWKVCNPQPCPAASKTFRQLQCEAIDPEYQAYYTSDHCSLVCRKKQAAFPQQRDVENGTRCFSDPTIPDVCIQGKCRRVSCSNELDSEVRLDRCGVCGGDSSTCRFVRKKWYERCPGYKEVCTVFEVPTGSTSVFVKQDSADYNLLGIKNKEGEYAIPMPSWSRTVYAAGTKIQYYHKNSLDINTITIPGPTTEKLTVVFYSVGRKHTGVWYELYDPTLSSNIGADDVEWNVTDWGECSWKCAKGKQSRRVLCTRKDDGSYVEDKVCLKKSKKPAQEQYCNTQPCEPHWYSSEWSSCSRTCGKGVQKRKVHCRRKLTQWKFQILPDSSCSGTKPSGGTQRNCNEIICHAEWRTAAWSKCSSTCQGGTKNRSLVCKRRNDRGELVKLPEILCHHAPKPSPTTMDCNTNVPCPTPQLLLRYRGLGCFKDGEPPAFPVLAKNFRNEGIDWSNIDDTIQKCAKFVYDNFPDNRVFTLEFYGECWTGREAEHSYNKYGASSECWNNVGKEHAFYAYEFY